MGLIDLYNNTLGKTSKLSSPQNIDKRSGENFFANTFQTNFTKNMLGKITQLTEVGKTYFSSLLKNNDIKQTYTPDNKYGEPK